MNAKELQSKSLEELQSELREVLKQQFGLRMQRLGEDWRPHLARNVRRQVARIKTVINEKVRMQGDDRQS